MRSLVVFLLMCIGLSQQTFAQKSEFAKILLDAKTVQIDTSFDYYKNRSPESIASEIEANGFEAVYYFIINDENVSTEIVEELHKRGIPVSAMVIPTGAYMKPEMLPEGWEKWKMEFTTDAMDSYLFLSFAHKDYVEWTKQRLIGLLKKHGFDGFTFAEAMYPIYNGPELDPVLYADVSEGFKQAFYKATGNKHFPDFKDKKSPYYFKKNKKLYNALVEYRIKTVNDFYDEIVNGRDGVRELCPEVTVATWTLGLNMPNGVAKLAEWEGNDIPSMIKLVKPDMHFIQTHHPDWSNPNLPGDYVKEYKPFFDAIKDADKDMKIGLQTDVGSKAWMRRDMDWVDEFYKTCKEMNVDSTTYYEFHLRWEVYSTAPKFFKAEKISDDSISLAFDQRIGAKSTEIIKGRVLVDDAGKEYKIVSADIDGSLLNIRLDRNVTTAKQLKLDIGGVCDDPTVRFPRSHVEPKPYGPVNSIPAGTFIEINVGEKLLSITGSLIQPPLFENWKKENWDTEFGYMKSVGMDHIILQWIVESDSRQKAYYPSKLGYKNTKKDCLKLCLQSAKENGFDVWIGLNWTDDWWKKGSTDTQWLKNEFSQGEDIASEIWAMYGAEFKDVIAGFYVTMEVDSYSFQKQKAQQSIIGVYETICDHIHDLTSKKVMVAPFFSSFSGSMNAKSYAGLWAKILDNAQIDVVALQDGIGCARGDAASVEIWFKELSKAIKGSKYKTEFWSDLETLERISEKPIKSVPAKASRILDQIKHQSKYVDRITSFSFNHFQSPQQGHGEVFEEYKKIIKALLRDQK